MQGERRFSLVRLFAMTDFETPSRHWRGNLISLNTTFDLAAVVNISVVRLNQLASR